jgi:Holliday junction resolvasome RuvABC ATP-dependent DNA helicase subunit
MIFEFVFLVVLIAVFIIYIQFKFYKKNQEFNNKIVILKNRIDIITEKSKIQKQKISFIDELNTVMKSSNETLNKLIFNFNFEMIENIYPKK